MATIKQFEDLEVWKQARTLARRIYLITKEGTFAKDFSLKDQINRSAGSIMDNIAEGFERDGRQEFIQFLAYAKGSAGELRSQLHRALDHEHLSEEEFDILNIETTAVSRALKGFISYLKNSEYKGTKYKADEPFFDDYKSEI